MNAFQSKYGPWALATGADAGIGKAIAHELAARELNVVAVARRQHLLDALKGELEEQCGVQVRTLALDLTEPNAVENIDRATQDVIVGLTFRPSGWQLPVNLPPRCLSSTPPWPA